MLYFSGICYDRKTVEKVLAVSSRKEGGTASLSSPGKGERAKPLSTSSNQRGFAHDSSEQTRVLDRSLWLASLFQCLRQSSGNGKAQSQDSHSRRPAFRFNWIALKESDCFRELAEAPLTLASKVRILLTAGETISAVSRATSASANRHC
jgi:hypothetical protein